MSNECLMAKLKQNQLPEKWSKLLSRPLITNWGNESLTAFPPDFNISLTYYLRTFYVFSIQQINRSGKNAVFCF